MKSLIAISALVLLAVSMMPAFADNPNTVLIPNNSATLDCVDSPLGCFSPRILTVNEGETVSFANFDQSAHTFKSVNNTLFDSGLVLAGGDPFYWVATNSTDYECEVHPWAKGHIEVIAAPVEPTVEPTVITVGTDKTQYSHGDTMTVNGTVSLPTNRDVVMKVAKYPEQHISDISSVRYIDVDETTGKYSWISPPLEVDADHVGTYVLAIEYSGEIQYTEFEILEREPEYIPQTTTEPTPTSEPINNTRLSELKLENRELKLEIAELRLEIKELNRILVEEVLKILEWVQKQ